MNKYIWLFACFILFVHCKTASKISDPKQEKWIQLFNGEDLDDWIVKIRGFEVNENFGNTFQVVDRLLTVSYDAYNNFDEQFGHLFHRDSFSYYRLKVEYRFIGGQASNGPGWAIRNSGMMLHCQAAGTMGVDQDFPISIEAQLLGGNGSDARTTMNLCTPGTHVFLADTLFTSHCINSTSDTYHGDQWVTAEALVLGDSLITHYVNGNEVLSYSNPQMGGGVVSGHRNALKKEGQLLTGGYISLQSESHPIQFRKVELLNLCGCMDDRNKAYKKYFVKHDPTACL